MERHKELSASLIQYYKNSEHINFSYFGPIDFIGRGMKACLMIKGIPFKLEYDSPLGRTHTDNIDHKWADLHSKIIDEIEVLEKLFKI